MNAKRNPVFVKKVRLRNPFQIVSLPLLSKFYQVGYRGYSSYLQKIVSGWMFRHLHKILWHAGWGGEGKFLYRTKEGDRIITFSARNTQFESLFMPRFINGYEAETTSLLDIIVDNTAVFYDIGSNWGHISLYVASREDFNGEIHAFEPFPSSFKDLQNIVKQAKMESVVYCHNVALSSSTGSKTMMLPEHLRSGAARVIANENGIRVETVTLDELKIKPPDVIKLDVEGHEKDVLAGGRKIFNELSPMLIMENHAEYTVPHITLEPLYFLVEMGYVLFQPAFIIHIDGYTTALPQGYSGKLPEEVEVGLFEFTPSERLLLGDYPINIFACHADKLDKLHKLFME